MLYVGLLLQVLSTPSPASKRQQQIRDYLAFVAELITCITYNNFLRSSEKAKSSDCGYCNSS